MKLSFVKTRFNKTILSILWIITSNSSFGQTGKIQGVIFDSLAKNPIEYATIAIFNSSDSLLLTGTISKNDGSWEIENIPFGTYFLKVDFIGYKSFIINDIAISQAKKKIDFVNINLSQVAKALKEVQIVSEKSYLEYKIDKKVVNVSKQLNASGGTATDAIKDIPSIETTLEGDIKLRGSTNFTLLIDGRPTLIDASDMMNQIPASTIEKIEIITNPSAKYDPDGTAGIINIITKKNSIEGLSSILNLSYGTGYQLIGDASILYHGKKTTLSGGIEFNDNNITTYEISDRRTTINDTVSYLSINERGNRFDTKKSLKFDISYLLTKHNTSTLSGNYNLLSIGHTNIGQTHLTDDNTSDYYISEDKFKIAPKVIELNFRDEQVFDSTGNHKLSFNLFMVNANVKTSENLNKYNTTFDFTTYLNLFDQTERNTIENVHLYDFDIDYQKPLGKEGILEAGLQAKLFNSSNNYKVFSFDEANSNTSLDETQSNSFDFSRKIFAAYTSLSLTFGQWQLKTGLRGEYTNRLLVQNTEYANYAYKKFDLYPSAYLSRRIQNNQQIQFSYSRRTERPGTQFLNPFIFFSDGFTAVKGNPYLEPDFTNSCEINYQKYFGTTMISAETYFRQTNNKITRVQEINNEGVLIRTMKNLEQDYSLGIEIMSNIKPIRWLEITPRATWYKYHLEGIYNADDIIKNSQNWRAGLTSSIKIKSNTIVQLTVNYDSPTVTLDGEREGIIYTDIAIKQFLFNRNFTISARFEDIFDSRHMTFISASDKFYQISEMYVNAPQAVISLSYRFNNYQKTKRNVNEDTNQYNIY